MYRPLIQMKDCHDKLWKAPLGNPYPLRVRKRHRKDESDVFSCLPAALSEIGKEKKAREKSELTEQASNKTTDSA